MFILGSKRDQLNKSKNNLHLSYQMMLILKYKVFFYHTIQKAEPIGNTRQDNWRNWLFCLWLQALEND